MDDAAAKLEASEEWLSVNDACEIMKVSRSTLYRMLKRGAITMYRSRGRLRFRRDDVIESISPTLVK